MKNKLDTLIKIAEKLRNAAIKSQLYSVACIVRFIESDLKTKKENKCEFSDSEYYQTIQILRHSTDMAKSLVQKEILLKESYYILKDIPGNEILVKKIKNSTDVEIEEKFKELNKKLEELKIKE